ncbi:MAG: biotin/lipoyl-binding protein [Abditibacteriota bacterium]|nr:biotin/lipoyl-binding protein [Abditibacteriota bacterium]
MDNSEIKKLLELTEEYDLEELELTEGDCSVVIKGPSARRGKEHELTEELPEPEEVSYAPDFDEKDDTLFRVTAPLVGVYYDSPSPGEPRFVSVGDRVEVGTELCLIEAMKVFSPIPSEVAGTVVSIDVKNADLVSEGQVIMRIKPEE